MTRDEVKKLFFLIMSVYPNFHAKDSDSALSTAIDGWWVALQNQDASSITSGLNRHIQSSKWPPSVHELIESAKTNKPDPVDIAAAQDEAYRRSNPDWMKGPPQRGMPALTGRTTLRIAE